MTVAPQPQSGGASIAPPSAAGLVIGARYQVLNELGSGGMGEVFRVLDRLTGRVATLKRLKTVQTPATSIGSGGRVALAQEFRLLASLRHPNIISVLDYGFDEDGDPYFTMDLEENAQTIIEAGRGRPLSVQVELIAQSLRALVYLHRHAIIHRDLKPENLVVVRDQVKLLDFGLSAYRSLLEADRGQLIGTMTHMAPEVVQGHGASERSDLYALGLIAYELLTGRYPFEFSDAAALYRDILHTSLPRPSDDIDARLVPIVARLLAKPAATRYAGAEEVIRDLEAALGQMLPVETVATRESFLQAAPFVGRTAESAALSAALAAAAAGQGGTWLVGGESGVGKSRLLEEVRIRALVEGKIVLRGQGVSQGGSPYHLWRDVLTHMLLHTEVAPQHASVLKSIVPGIAKLVGYEVADPPPVDATAVQSRLLIAVEELFTAAQVPVVVLLDDLQWAGSESLKMLSWMTRAAEALPLFFLGSYRTDDAPQLPDVVGATRQLTLARLAPDEVAALCESVIGAQPHSRDVIELVQRESEGNPLFIVEVLRTLAESSGQLGRIGESGIPRRVIGGGMQRVLRRRLAQLPLPALGPLQSAAVIGRALDADVLAALHPDLDVGRWATDCAAAIVLEDDAGVWRFTHDKLREQLLQDLDAATRRALHRRIAEAMERLYADRAEYVTALAHHWGGAGDAEKEAWSSERAGMLALESGACREAVTYLERASELLQAMPDAAPPRRVARGFHLDLNAAIDPASRAFHLAQIQAALTESHFRLGNLAVCRVHAERTLTLINQPTPTHRLGWAVGLLQQVMMRSAQSVWLRGRAGDAQSRQIAAAIAPVEHRMTEAFFYALNPMALVWSVLRIVNRCEPAGPSPALAQAYILLAILAETLPLRRVAKAWRQRAMDITEQSGTPRDLALALSRTAVIDLGSAAWAQSDASLTRAIALAEEVGDVRLLEECHSQFSAHYFFTAQYERGLVSMRKALALCRRSGNRQAECWALLGIGDMLVRLGRPTEAVPYYDEGLQKLDERTTTADTIWGMGMRALARLRAGDDAGAFASARGALSYLLVTQPLGYWMQHGTAATAEVFLALLGSRSIPLGETPATLTRYARQATACLRRFARRFPVGRPHALLWSGHAAQLAGKSARAVRLWRRAIAAAEQLGTPYEEGRGHYDIGRQLPPQDPQRAVHLDRAREIFERIGCPVELAWTTDELSRTHHEVTA